MAQDSPAEKVWKMIESIPLPMLVTKAAQSDGAESLRGRPMSAHVRKDEHAIYLLSDVRRHKDDEITRDPNVCLTFHGGGADYVSVSGTARISDNRAKIKELWSPEAKAWWDGPEDPNICLITITPERAEYWDSPGKIIAYAAMLTAAATGTKPKMGDSGSTRL
jgi:general stress protein 26